LQGNCAAKAGLAFDEAGDRAEVSDFNNQCTVKSEKGLHRNRERAYFDSGIEPYYVT